MATTSPDLARLLATGNISRREFMTRMTAMGAAAAIPTVLASADAMAATPKRGGDLKMGLFGASTNNVLFAGDPDCCATFMISYHRSVSNTLIGIDENFQPIPELAAEFTPTNNGQTWAFKLQPGVEFHNGKSLDANDVVETLNIHRGPDSTSPAKTLVNPIKEIKAKGKDTVMFELETPNADFPAVMSAYQLMIYPAGEQHSGIGTGAFVKSEFNSGVRALVKRNPNYWREGPYFDSIESIAIHDAATKVSALRTGEVDVIDHPDLKTVGLLAKQPGFQVIKVRGTQHYTTPMDITTPPYDNNDLRLAVKYAMPRDQLVSTILRDFGSAGNDIPIASQQRYFNKDLPQRQYDPDKVKFHLKKAGMENVKLQLHASDAAFVGCVDAAVLMQESAAKAGLNIEVVREQVDGYWTEVWLKKPWCFSYYSGRPTEDWMFSLVYAADATWNETRWNHPRFEKLLVLARAELNDDLRRELYYEMQLLLWEEGAQVITMFADHVMAASDKVKFPPNLRANFELDGMRAAERWWFA